MKNRVVLGCMTFGPAGTDCARITELDEFKKCLDVFQQRGYNEIDTARMYTSYQQEDFTRKAGWKERGLSIDTKVAYPNKAGDNAPDKVIKSVEESLKALDAECVDVLYLHRPDRGTPFAETLGAVDKLHKAGKFKKLGVSNFAAFELAEVVMICQAHGWVRPTIYQAMYNVVARNIEQELIVACRRYGLDIVVYNPLAGGLFSGKIKTKDVEPGEGRFANNNWIGALYRNRYLKDSTLEALRLVEPVAEKHGLSLVEIAMRWLVHHSKLRVRDGNDGVIIGVSSTAQLSSNLDHLEKGPLPDEVVEVLELAWQTCKAQATVYWHGNLTYDYDTQKALFGTGSA